VSFSSEEEVVCPCGETFEAILWNSVNLKEDPDLRDMLLSGALNVHACSMCKRLVYAERFVLVHDPASELLAFVHPTARASERELLEAAMLRDTAQAQAVEGGMKIAYPPVLLFGMDALVELVHREEEESDQGAVMESLGGAGGFTVVSLSPSRARALGLPSRLPVAGEGAPRDRLLAGVRAVLAANDRLTVYEELRKRVEKDGLTTEAAAALA
jgi:hypothetical protein